MLGSGAHQFWLSGQTGTTSRWSDLQQAMAYAFNQQQANQQQATAYAFRPSPPTLEDRLFGPERAFLRRLLKIKTRIIDAEFQISPCGEM